MTSLTAHARSRLAVLIALLSAVLLVAAIATTPTSAQAGHRQPPRHPIPLSQLHVIHHIPANAALPDIRVKQLNRCGKGDMDATGGTCFLIQDPGVCDPDFPTLCGQKLLKFPVITLNSGKGPAEIDAYRKTGTATRWKSYQTFYTKKGRQLGSLPLPGVKFFFAGDGHHHWHVKDFDQYALMDADGTLVARDEKHGYCLQDNTTYGPLEGKPNVPPDPGVYLENISCGKNKEHTKSIIHGLSRGWGDTYPTSLDNQCVVITGLSDGNYTAMVHVDALNRVHESNEKNNIATMEINITGDVVTTFPDTATGGLP